MNLRNADRCAEVPLGVECALPPQLTEVREQWPARKPRLLVWLALALAGIGAWQFGQAGYIHAKAWLAQALLARAWDRTLAGAPAAKPWPWADTWPVARLAVPDCSVDLFVLAGANGRAIAFGPGHVIGTPAPGEPGNTVLGGHRDTHFAFLKRVKSGDELKLQAADGRWRTYRVASAVVTDKDDLRPLAQDGALQLTLITCYPFDALRAGGPLRYVVTALAEGPA